MTIRLTIINEEPDGGDVATIQVGIDAYRLAPGQQATVYVDDLDEAVISKETD